MLVLLLFSWLLSAQLFAAGQYPTSQRCRAELLLRGKDYSGIVASTRAYLRARGGDGATEQFGLLQELLANPKFQERLMVDDEHAAKLLLDVANKGASQNFYRKAVRLLEALPKSAAKEMVLPLVKKNLLPDVFPSARHLDETVFGPSASLSPRAQTQLRELLSNDAYLSPKTVVRRIFAYMLQNPELSQDQKIALAENIMTEMQTLQKDLGEGAVRAFQFVPAADKAASSDGTRFICGKAECSYFFAVKADGSFFVARKGDLDPKFSADAWEQTENLREAVP